MKRKILYFINPISGTRKKSGLEDALNKATTAKGIECEVAHTDANANYIGLREKILSEKITDIVICGGDGSVNQIGQNLLGLSVNIGIIPMGSGNGLAFTAGIPKTISKALEIIFTGKVKEIDGFRINNRFSCMLCGLGLDAQVAADFANQQKRGLASYIRQSTLNFFSAKPYPFEITIKGTTITTEAFFISIANSNQFGNNFTIAPKASLTDGLLDIVIVKKMSKLRMIWAVVKQLRNGEVLDLQGETYAKADILYFQTSRLKIANPMMAPLHIDGEAVESDLHFNIEIIPRALKLLQPG
ncbi:MAG: YegS/Rv2252/BmrU family lipid kinase [Chitinophagaceae bacterium]